MATIKAYTDLSQSKTLAKILPIESADMLWGYYYNGKNHCIPNIRPFRDGRNEIPKCYIPAWSLAALLDILPDHFYDKTGRKKLGMDKGDTYYNIFYENRNSYIQKSADNLVDACYELILKLHELKML